jgi:hypothetical protein
MRSMVEGFAAGAAIMADPSTTRLTPSGPPPHSGEV